MGQPVKLSDSLVLDARKMSVVAERSIAGQIEYWAGLGRAIEPLLRTDRALALKRNGDAVPLSQCLESVETAAGRAKLTAYLATVPFPHFEPGPRTGQVIRIDRDGKRTLGRFVGRQFRSVRSR